MTSFWTSVLDWFLPSIRLTDNIHDLEALRFQNIIASSRPRQLGASPAQAGTASHHRDHKSRGSSEAELNGRRSRLVVQDLDAAAKVDKLAEENERLKRELNQLRTQLAHEHRRSTGPVAFPTTSSPPVSPTSTAFPSSAALSGVRGQLQTNGRDSSGEAEAVLRAFMDKTDAADGASLLQNVKDMNTQIQHFAASVADAYHTHIDSIEKRKREMPHDVGKVARVVGERMVQLLATRDHAQDPIFIQYAIQAWEIGRAKMVFDCFCFGAPRLVDQTLSAVFKDIYTHEPPTVAFRWRALSHSYLKAHLSRMPTIPPTPVTPGTGPTFLDPFDQYVEQQVQEDISGVQIILTTAGWRWSRTSLRDELLRNHRERLGLIYTQILKIETSLRQDYMSALYEMSVVPPALVHVSTNDGLERSRLHIDVDLPLGRGSSQYDGNTMENVLSGIGEQYGAILCTVEMGLTVVEEGPQQGGINDKRRSINRARSLSSRRFTVGPPEAISRASSSGDESLRRLMERVLLKPKVLLESFTKYI